MYFVLCTILVFAARSFLRSLRICTCLQFILFLRQQHFLELHLFFVLACFGVCITHVYVAHFIAYSRFAPVGHHILKPPRRFFSRISIFFVSLISVSFLITFSAPVEWKQPHSMMQPTTCSREKRLCSWGIFSTMLTDQNVSI